MLHPGSCKVRQSVKIHSSSDRKRRGEASGEAGFMHIVAWLEWRLLGKYISIFLMPLTDKWPPGFPKGSYQ